MHSVANGRTLAEVAADVKEEMEEIEEIRDFAKLEFNASRVSLSKN